MSGISGAINTALTGLQLFEAGIATISNNLANQQTPGYAVETVSAIALAGSPGQPGQGVGTPQIQRAASGFAAGLLRTANAAGTAASAQSTSLTTISNALTNNGDVQTAINQFFQDFSSLAANPTSAAERQTVLSDAQGVVSSFQSAAGVINGVITGATTSLSQNVTAANNLLGQLATINKDFSLAPNQPALQDQQQAVLNSLSNLLPVHPILQPNGSIIVVTGGTVLLDQSGVQTLAVTPATATTGPAVTAGSASTLVQTGALDGAIGAAVASYDSGTTALQGLNALASIFATNVNIGQAQGLTSTGSSGSALFSVPAPSVTASASNTGTAVVTSVISNSAQLPTDGGPFLLTYTTLGGWSALDQASGVTYTGSGVPPSFAGVTLTITGAPANGDQFTLNPAPGASTGISVAAANTTAIAAAEPYVATPGTLQANGSILNSNGGTLNVGNDSVVSTPATGAAVIPASYFGQSLQFNFTSPTAFNVSTTAAPGTTIASGTLGANTYGNVAIAYPASGAATGTYWQLPVSGTPVAGDVLTLTTGGPSSGGNATRIAGLWAAPGATTAGTLQQAIVGFGTSLGANAQTAQQSATATASQVSTATTNLQTVSGVSADQQAVTLTNYQQAYQAAAQAISAAHTAFESLLQSV